MYYRIQNSLNNKIIGCFTQVQDFKAPSDWDTNPHFIETVEFERVEFEPILSIGILAKKAKLTDLLSTSSVGFTRKLLVSSKFKEILEEVGNSNFQFFECVILINTEEYQYWLISPVLAQYKFVDFFKSDVVARKDKPEGGTYLQAIDVSFNHDFSNFINSQGIDSWKTVINHVFFKEDLIHDFFALGHVEGGVGYFVSERLKKVIEEQSLTGIEFKPSELNLGEWLGGTRERIYGKA
ncbi:imm11 family protein [Pedobacter agri]|uniref:imm11 family protein n=1 Tax=Pedobacter agri TaxID=454586 RepID=UPI00292D6DDD|nr:DUF1629 domain-containing protein [Pedobacter agri]